MKKIHFLTLLFFIVMLPYHGFSTILHVPVEYSSIQTGIDASVDGDMVLVEPGTYYENLNLNGKNIILCSNYFTTGDPAFINSTIIDGSSADRVITINNYEISSCQVVGFTVQHGYSPSIPNTPYGGGGIFISDASPQILHCIIQNNYAPDYGGGLCVYGSYSSAKVMDCTIRNNTANSYGGGVFMGDCAFDAEISNSIITGNSITCDCAWNGGGGGVNLYHTGKLVNCLITNNSAPNASVGGGGVHCDWGDPANQAILIIGCTIVNNTAFNNGGTSYVIEGGEFRNCIIWGNTDQYGNISNYDGNSYVNCCTDPLPAGAGNISSYPDFADVSLGNFRLMDASPCIDAGDNSFNDQSFDLDGYSRIVGGIIDMGAYEYGSGTGTEVQIGSGSDQSWQFPIYSCYNYNYSQQIYLGSEITDGGGSSGLIKKIRFYYAGGGSVFSNWNNWTIYLGNTEKTEFSSTSDWVPVGSMTQVFSGTFSDPAEGTWIEFTLSAPFYYSGSNIMVAVDENSNGWDCTALWGSFYSGAPRGLSYYDDDTNPDPASPPVANYDPDAYIAQVQFEINTFVGTIEGYVMEEPDCMIPIEGATITTGTHSATSDSTGYYQMILPAGTYYDLTAIWHDAIQTIFSVDIAEGSTTSQDFCLTPYFAPPVNLQASVTGPLQNNVHLTWLAPGSAPDQWIHWDNGVIWGALGYSANSVYTVASRWPVTDIAPYNGTFLKKIRFVAADAAATYTLKVWKGSNASTLLLSQVVTDPFIGTWNEITLDTPILIDGTQELWFGYEIYQHESGYPAGLGPGPAVAGKGDMINAGYGWFSVKEAWGWEFNWTLQGFVSESPVLGPVHQIIPGQIASLQSVAHEPIPASVKPTFVKSGQVPSSTLPSVNLPAANDIQPDVANNAPSAPSSTLTGYNVYRDNFKIADNIPDLSYDDFALPKGGYDYEVSAQYANGESVRIGPAHVDIYTCFPPTNLMVSNTTLTATTADLSWTPSTISTNHQWDIEWGPAGFALGSGTSVFANYTPAYEFSNLTPGTEYDVYVRTYCSASDRSAWVKKTFRTHYFDCPVNSIPEGEACGDSVDNGCNLVNPLFKEIGCGDTICGTAWLTRSHRDTDWYSFTLSQTTDVTFNVNGEFSNFVGLANAPCPVSGYFNSFGNSAGFPQSMISQLSPGTYYLMIAPNWAEQVVCDSLSRYWVRMDCSTCLTPTALNVINISSSSADLTWTSNASTWNIEWGPAGFIRGSGNMISGTDQNPYTLTGLTNGYTYSFYVQSDCGGGTTSNWAGPYNFFLPCPPTSLPYSEDFTSQLIGFTPQCWQVQNYGSPTNWIVDLSSYAGSVFPELVFNSWNPWFSGRSFLTSPVINTLGQSALNLSFKQYLTSYSSGTSCEIWTTSDGGITWSSVWSVAQAGILGPETKNLVISTSDVGSATFQFAFAVNGNSWDIGTWHIDDITLNGSSGANTLNLQVFLEGFYSPDILEMRPVQDADIDGNTWNNFAGNTVDTLSIYLADPFTWEYLYALHGLPVSPDGTISTPAPVSTGDYYIVVKHRSSVETWSSDPVLFDGNAVYYNFTFPASQAFGNNLKEVPEGSGTFVLFGGDITSWTGEQDGYIDIFDNNEVFNQSQSGAFGYQGADVNGDGYVDIFDMVVVFNNMQSGVGMITPPNPGKK